jgi:peptidoglycan hydrolase CwlO-like protein
MRWIRYEEMKKRMEALRKQIDQLEKSIESSEASSKDRDTRIKQMEDIMKFNKKSIEEFKENLGLQEDTDL